MKTRQVVALLVTAGVLGAGVWYYLQSRGGSAQSFRTATIERGPIQSTVAATGALGAVKTVQVGTQVSGQIAAILVDFNDKVKKGQLIARIDPKLAQQAIQDAEAGLAKANAQLIQTQALYQQNKTLHDQRIITDTDFNTAQANFQVAKADLASAQVSVDRARQNLAYTNIYAPIDGVVVERNMDVGQTVAASLSAPQLFLIANDLSQMQILALVDESDIGQIHVGQTATFTVQSFPNRSFTGEVKQVRLNATTTNNVVDYTTVVAVQNPNGVLLPGMTATVRFITGSADSAYTVPNAALRYRPTPEVLASAGIKTAGDSTLARRTRPAGTTAADSASRPAQPGGRTRSSSLGASTGTRSIVTLWVLDSVGKLSSRRVRTGLTDGQRTQIEGRGLVAGEQVVIGTTDGATTSPSTAPQSSSPFQQPAAPSGRRGPPPGPI